MKGADRHIKRLRRLAAGAEAEAAKVVYVGSDMIRAHAFRSISAGSVSGKNHVPSAPGQPPNRDTGVLQAHITNEMVGPVTAEVRSDATYANDLEFGTSKMAARPYMRPARDAKRKEIQKLFVERMNNLVRSSGR